MSIEFQCNQCHSILRVPTQHAGKQARCPQCEFINMIPMSSTAPTATTSPDDNPTAGQSDPGFSSPASPPPGGNPYQPTAATNPVKQVEAHRGGLILGLGIFSVICTCCFIPGLLAWIFGATDLKKMANGTMDPSGETLTRVGMILGIVGTAFCLLGTLFGFLVNAIELGVEQNF